MKNSKKKYRKISTIDKNGFSQIFNKILETLVPCKFLILMEYRMIANF